LISIRSPNEYGRYARIVPELQFFNFQSLLRSILVGLEAIFFCPKSPPIPASRNLPTSLHNLAGRQKI